MNEPHMREQNMNELLIRSREMASARGTSARDRLAAHSRLGPRTLGCQARHICSPHTCSQAEQEPEQAQEGAQFVRRKPDMSCRSLARSLARERASSLITYRGERGQVIVRDVRRL
jgi:hypothetical protein